MERLMFKRSLLAAAAGVVALGASASWAPEAHAVLQLRVEDGISTTTVVDNGAGDLDDDLGQISTFINNFGTVGVDILSSATSSLPLGGAPFLAIDPNANAGNEPFSLRISATDTGFSLESLFADFETSASATVEGADGGETLTVKSFIDLSNTEFGEGTLVGELASGGAALEDFAQTVTTEGVAVDDEFSMTIVTEISSDGGISGGFKYDADLITVPEPGTLSLAGLGLLGLGLAWRRRQKVA